MYACARLYARVCVFTQWERARGGPPFWCERERGAAVPFLFPGIRDFAEALIGFWVIRGRCDKGACKKSFNEARLTLELTLARGGSGLAGYSKAARFCPVLRATFRIDLFKTEPLQIPLPPPPRGEGGGLEWFSFEDRDMRFWGEIGAHFPREIGTRSAEVVGRWGVFPLGGGRGFLILVV